MSIDEQPIIKHLKGQMSALGLLLKINKVLTAVGLGSKTMAEVEIQYTEAQKQLQEIIDYPPKFNEYFSQDGWLAHDSLNFDVLKHAVHEYETKGKEQGVSVLLDYYKPHQIEKRLFLFNHVQELRIRRKFIDYALVEDRAGRYYSAVPLLLMTIDGAVNDAIGKGFHASDINFDVWGSLMVADGAIYKIKEIFQKARKKTRSEQIELPYRNGILHGMDLGYDNSIVTAKCWCFLFVVRDWLVSKKSEEERKKAFQEETQYPSLREITKQSMQTARLQQAIDSWKPRDINAGYINSLNNFQGVSVNTPEYVAIEFLDYWEQENYGKMAELFYGNGSSNLKAKPGDVRQQFASNKIGHYSIDWIVDETPAISEIDVKTFCAGAEAIFKSWLFRMIREDEQGNIVAANMSSGIWKIVWVHEKTEVDAG